MGDRLLEVIRKQDRTGAATVVTGDGDRAPPSGVRPSAQGDHRDALGM
jgi:hypothetical protein